MITVNFFTTLRIFLNTNQVMIQSTEMSIKELLRKSEEQVSKRFLHKLLNQDGQILPGVMILVNGRNVLHLEGVNTLVKGGDVVAIFPPGGGG
jgi:molybdopterin synthase sulfur carrier subunit